MIHKHGLIKREEAGFVSGLEIWIGTSVEKSFADEAGAIADGVNQRRPTKIADHEKRGRRIF